MRGKTVIFDLDGTLADTSGDLIAAANTCFRDMGAGDVLDAKTDAGTALRGGRAMLTLGMDRLGRASDTATIEKVPSSCTPPQFRAAMLPRTRLASKSPRNASPGSHGSPPELRRGTT